MDLNLSVFQEPRGVMRIFHLIFSICAFSTITGYTGYISYQCNNRKETDTFSYPFDLVFDRHFNKSKDAKPVVDISCTITVTGDFSSDAKFFVATGVLAMLYSLAIIVVYIKFDENYKRNSRLPLYDFLITVVLAVLWLSGSAAWANGLSGLKSATNPPISSKPDCQGCSVNSGNFSTLNISVIFGFLNFFLWAADLWFVYKETEWFQGIPTQTAGGI